MNFDSYEKRYGITLYQFIEIAKSSLTATEASEKLGLPFKTYAKVAKKLDVYKTNPGRKGLPGHRNNAISLDEILEGLHPNYQTNHLKNRLIEAGIKKWECEWCGISEWRNERIGLQLDHINGNNSDHRLENLRILCPNCHSQTPTYSAKKRPNEFIPKEERPLLTNAERIERLRQRNDLKNNEKAEEVRNAGINFRIKGWVKAVAFIVDIEPGSVHRWMKRFMPEVHRTAYKKG